MNFLNSLGPYAHWGLRLSLAATFLYHGWGKVPPAGFAEMFGMPVAVAGLVMLAELSGGLALIAGAFTKDIVTRYGGFCVVIINIGAIYIMHFANGFNVMNKGYEFNLLMLVVGLYFLTRGNDV